MRESSPEGANLGKQQVPEHFSQHTERMRLISDLKGADRIDLPSMNHRLILFEFVPFDRQLFLSRNNAGLQLRKDVFCGLMLSRFLGRTVPFPS